MKLYVRLLQKDSNSKIGFFKDTLKKVFGKYLIITNTLSCGGLMALGDAIQQECEIYRGEHKSATEGWRHDWKRINRMFWVGLAQGPSQHLFYNWLDYFIPSRSASGITKKILLDQLVASPMCLLIFFLGLGYFEDHSLEEICAEIRAKFFFIYKVDWMVWPPVQMINFYYLSPKYRVVYINFVTMLYDVFLSYAKHDIKY